MFASPAYAADGAEANENPVMEFFGNLADGAAQFFGLSDGAETYAAGDQSVVADGETIGNWSSTLGDTTENVGRIWTDKTVSADANGITLTPSNINVPKDANSDFLIGLSALSSTSNLMTSTSQPLDIVLVMDVSGSMAQNRMGETTYEDVYTPIDASDVVESRGHTETGWFEIHVQDSRGGTYYVQNDNEGYDRVTEVTERVGDRWNGYDEHVRWEVNGQEVDPNTTQFYTHDRITHSAPTRMEALQTAADGFINSVNEANASIANEDQKHRVALVKFADDSYRYSIGDNTADNGYNYTQVVSDFSTDADALISDINGLEAAGATSADYGMTLAKYVLDGGTYGNRNNRGTYVGARENAQRVVIFFTDGEPNHYNNWDGSVASDTINLAHDLKNTANEATDALIYTIGVFNGANPNDTNGNFNRYMNAVSSNYPDAECSDRWGQTDSFSDLVLGNRAQAAEEGDPVPQYYFSATDSDELSAVFENIFQDIQEIAAQAPTKVEQGQNPAESGYITFNDVLGDYMSVSGDTLSIVYGDVSYTATKNEQGQFVFGDTPVGGNGVYESGNLSDVKITVTPGSGSAGDTVTVQVPASLIPCRAYDISTEDGVTTTTISKDAYPIRIFYNVSLRESTEEGLNNPDQALQAYINDNLDESGEVQFYANKYTGGTIAGETVGDTTATFTPSTSNSFYLFTQNTPIYTNDACTDQASWWDVQNPSQDTFYYKYTYYTVGQTAGTEKVVAFPATNMVTSGAGQNVNYDQNGAYVMAGTQKTTRIDNFSEVKTNQQTDTANAVVSPEWSGDSIVAHLGNNGRISVELPGTLTVTKNAEITEGSTGPVDQNGESTLADQSFNFNLTFTNAPNGATFVGKVMKDGVQQGGDVPFSATGGTFSLKDGETLYVYGLTAGMTYTVSETQQPAGFAQTAPVDGGQPTNAVGTIASGNVSAVTFENTYTAEPTSLDDAGITLAVQKVLEGRDWRDTDSFKFDLVTNDGAPTPAQDASVVVANADESHTKAFGNIEFTAAGTYTYTVTEDNDVDDPIVGIDYSGESYTVTVSVVDDGQGHLTIPDNGVTIQKTANQDGQGLQTPETVSGTTMAFTNIYNANEGTTNINGTKVYTNESGANPIRNGKFTFQIEALGGYETDDGSSVDYTIAASDVPMPDGTPEGSTVATTPNTGYGFSFPTIRFSSEDVDHTFEYKVTEVAGNEKGMTYSDAEYTLQIAVTDREDDGQMTVVATPSLTQQELSFTNTFDPIDVTLSGDTAIDGTKTLNGRDMLAGEEYTFTLTPTESTADAINAGYVSGITADGLTQTVSGAAENAETPFSFASEGGITFNRAGTYTFVMSETAGNLDGMTYDTHDCTVTVKVGLDTDKGELTASVDYGTYQDRAGNSFVNTYEASMNYGAGGAGGINVSKTLTGRDMLANEFTFSIAGVDSDTVSADEAEQKITDDDMNFANDSNAENGVADVMAKFQNVTFNQNDKNKVFTYEVRENRGDLAKVGYDQNVYTVAISVHDNGDGDMYAITTVTDAAGEEVARADSRTDQPVTVAFSNTYTPDSVTTNQDADSTLKVTKQVTGAPTDADFNFTLTLVYGDGSAVSGLDQKGHATVTDHFNDGDTKEATFGEISFSKAGTYVFQASEDEGLDEVTDPSGWTYATNVPRITVVVTDENPAHETEPNQPLYDGKLYIESVTNNNPTFTNSYDHGEVTLAGDTALQVEKAVTGWTTDVEFSFTLAPVTEGTDANWDTVEYDGSALKASVGGFISAADLGAENAKPASFGAITFTEPGTYQFTVTEDQAHDDAGDPAGWTYDKAVHRITVTVSETNAGGKYDGQLHATVTTDMAPNTDPVLFTNTYTAGAGELTGKAGFTGTKTVEGRPWLNDESFGFTYSKGEVADDGDWSRVTYVSGDGTEAAFDTVTATATENDNESVNFWPAGTFKFAQPGTYTFNVSETSHNESDGLPKDGNGITYDRHVGTVTVEVTDNGSGTLQTRVVPGDVTEGEDQNNMTFVNRYDATPVTYGTDDVLLGGTKTVDDTVGTYEMADNQFTFMMRGQAAGVPMPTGLTESTDSDNRPVVSVTNKDTNTQNNTATYDFGEIKFTHDDMAGVSDDDGDGKVTKTFQYNVYENENGMPAGISPETAGLTYTVTITVTEDYKTGTMTADASVERITPGSEENVPVDMGKMDFTNVYRAGQTDGSTEIFKTLDGRNWQQGDTFTFDVKMKADGVAVADLPSFNFDNIGGDVAGYTEADGQVSYSITITPEASATGNTYAFKTGTATYTHAGEYVYTISERGVDSSVAGVSKDNTVYTVTVTITEEIENGQPVLKRSVSMDPTTESGRVDFTNVYTATGTVTGSEVFDVSKTLTGRENDKWTANDVFTFEMTGSEDAPMPEGSDGQTKTITVSSDQLNDEGVGINNFGDIAYGNADRDETYTYTIREVAGNLYGVTYSQAEYQVTVTVNDNTTPNGQLSIETSMTQVKDDQGNDADNPADIAAFTNTYKVDEDSKDVSRVDGDVTTNVNGQLVGVGDTLEYTIHWVNDAVDEHGMAQAATVTVTDNVPEGLTVDANSISNGGALSQDGRTITWTVEADAAEQGDVTYQATVDDSAVQGGQLTNTATVQVGDNDPHQRVEATVEVPQKSGENNNQRPDGSIQVGDRITYTIDYANTTDQAADITITDVVPTGVTVDQGTIDNDGLFDPDNNTITWTLEGVKPGVRDTVSFVGVVNESAVHGSETDNQATIQVGKNGPVIKTNTVPGTVNKGDLVISKTIKLTDGQGTQIDAAKEFEFTIKVADASGNALNGTYNLDHADDTKDGTIAFANGEATLTLKHDESATIAGLPEGAQVTVTETAAAGYTPVDGAEKTATIAAGDTPASIEFVNTYSVSEVEGVPADFDFTKVFAGHAWTDAYSFQFKLTSVDNAPMPEADEANGVTIDENGNAIKTVTGPQESDEATFDFGAITYSQPGVYYYTVSEVPGKNPGIDWSGNVANVTVTVKDNGNGTLSASASIPNSTFTNTYKTGEVPFDTAAGLQIVKNMTGRAIGAGDFTFTMTGKDDVSIARLNNGQPLEISTTGTDLGNTGDSNVASEVISVPTELTFTQEDVGNTYTYTVTETNGGQTTNGVTYDDASYEVKFVVTENGEGTLLVETFVNGVSQGVTQGAIATNELPAQLVFNNSYDAGSTTVGAKGATTIEGTKTLANDDIANYNFTFTVKGENGAEVATGSNNGTETITFGDIVYTTENLNAAVTAEGSDVVGKATKVENADGTTTYTFKYTVSENAPDADSGVAANSAPQGVTVTVTDNGTGQLSAAVSYDEGDALAFKNTYGGDARFELGIAGNKVIASADGLNKPGLKGGEYEFTIVGNPAEDGTPAPMPEVTMVTNGASGIVNFGPIEYTMENVFGTDATTPDATATSDEGVETLAARRVKVFTYNISESGTLPGVTNEQGTKTVEVTVTDLGGGKIEAQVTSKKTASGTDFTFTNTYNVKSEDSSLTGEDGFSITKKLTANTGRTLADGEFKFVLTDVATGNVVARATNTAAGEVEFPIMTFDKPGAYKYELSEVPGNAAGVNYDGDKYNVTANVTDMGDGTLAVEWDIEGVDAGGSVVFENTYEADPTTITFGALKTLTGRDMVEGEFTFELTDAEGNVVTTTNGANGSVVFPTVEFTKEGTYEYTVSEALPNDDDPNTDGVQKDGVTYDEKVWTATVNVVDNTETGVLEATVDYGNNGELPVFTNTYTEPPAPVEPDEVIPATGDAAVAAVAATVAIGGTLVAAGYVTSKKRGE